MLSKERDYYLANILLFAQPEPTLDPEYLSRLDVICNEIQADSDDVQQARQWLQQGTYRLKPVGRYSERVRNLEDMLLMAMLTGNQDKQIKQQLLEFAKNLGINQQQMQWLLEESRQHFLQETAFASCQSCGKRIPSRSRYCPECGTVRHQNLLGQQNREQFSSLPERGLSLVFPLESAAPELLRRAKQAPSLRKIHHQGGAAYCVNWPLDKLHDALEFVSYLRQQIEPVLYVDGARANWDEVFAFLPCMQTRQGAFQPDEHCFGLEDWKVNIWGCKQAKMDWLAGEEWFTYGYFDSHSIFVFDKQRIEHQLQQRLKPYHNCPFLSQGKLSKVLENLPNKVLIAEESHWGYLETDQEVPGGLPLKFAPGQEQRKPRFAIGVVPLDFSEATKIIKRVFPEAQLRSLLQKR